MHSSYGKLVILKLPEINVGSAYIQLVKTKLLCEIIVRSYCLECIVFSLSLSQKKKLAHSNDGQLGKLPWTLICPKFLEWLVFLDGGSSFREGKNSIYTLEISQKSNFQSSSTTKPDLVSKVFWKCNLSISMILFSYLDYFFHFHYIWLLVVMSIVFEWLGFSRAIIDRLHFRKNLVPVSYFLYLKWIRFDFLDLIRVFYFF